MKAEVHYRDTERTEEAQRKTVKPPCFLRVLCVSVLSNTVAYTQGKLNHRRFRFQLTSTPYRNKLHAPFTIVRARV
jgi:hypothetical protein